MNESYSYISHILTDWYLANKRDLPWRNTKDPYKIWISEIILQQTRVVQGYNYYQRFIQTFPDVKALANADEDTVLKLWQGLGYYSRARNLHTAAKIITSTYNGVFPSEYNQILGLKGIGEYTASAVASFAFDQAHAVLDGNVFRVLSRLFGIATPIDSTEGKKEFKNLADKLLNQQDPGLHNQAIMEFGALQCVPVSPTCSNCPLSQICIAYAEKRISQYPVKAGKTEIKNRFFNYLDIRFDQYTYVNKRTNKDIWKNLYEFPLIETSQKITFEELQENNSFKQLLDQAGQITLHSSPISFKHVLSHRVIFATFYKIDISSDNHIANKYTKIERSDLDQYAVSRLVHKYIEYTDKTDLFL